MCIKIIYLLIFFRIPNDENPSGCEPGPPRRNTSFSDEEINDRIVKMIAVNQMPISFVSSAGYKILMELFPGHVSIKEEAVKRRLRKLHEDSKNTIMNNLEKNQNVALTTDLWTSVAIHSYLTVVSHSIDENWSPKVYTLDTVSVEEKHTSENISSTLSSVMSKWTNNTIVSGIVTDNARNMLGALRTIEDVELRDQMTCASHSLQLVINKAIDTEHLNSLFTTASKLVGHFKHSSTASEELKRVQQQLELKTQKLKQRNKTRWNSTFMMLERLFHNRAPISNVLANRQVCNSF